jgi:hypothetical protein
VADENGRFHMKNVPAGDYKVEVWHEASSRDTNASVTVSASTPPVALTVGDDRRPNPYPPDKYGKARQTQLGY